MPRRCASSRLLIRSSRQDVQPSAGRQHRFLGRLGSSTVVEYFQERIYISGWNFNIARNDGNQAPARNRGGGLPLNRPSAIRGHRNVRGKQTCIGRCLTNVPFAISIRNSPTLTVAYAGRVYPDARCFQNVWYYVDMAGLIVRFRMQHAVQPLPSASLHKEAAATS
jgi:hypothetical protein